MNFVTKKSISRRTMLRGAGATVALPLLDSMIPAQTVFAQSAAAKAAARTRLVCIEQVHGAAGCSPFGAEHYLWAPKATGKDFDITPGSLAPLDPWKKHLTIISNTDAKMAEALA